MSRSQTPILAPPPAFARFFVLDLAGLDSASSALQRIVSLPPAENRVIGFGAPFALALGANVSGLRALPALAGHGCAVPSTQGALFVSIEAHDPTAVHDEALALLAALGNAFVVREEVAGFKYAGGRDLSGYVDGTENPKGDAAAEAAIIHGEGSGRDGGSFVAVQRWQHDLRRFGALSAEAQDAIVGRRKSTNEEMEDAPPFAHVKRSAQESFDPPAFILRRSMPWGNATENGLHFIAYGRSLDFFERILRRMVGLEDGVVDGLFRFSRPVSGGYYFCPPRLENGALDLSALTP